MDTACLGRGSTSFARRNQSAVWIGAESGSALTALRISESRSRPSLAQSVCPFFFLTVAIYHLPIRLSFRRGCGPCADNAAPVVPPDVHYNCHDRTHLAIDEHSFFAVVEAF